jgi:hypothetical protein
MKRLLSVALFIVFLPLLAMAQSDFDGTWKVDLTKSTMFIPSAVLFPQCQRGSQGCAGAMLTAIFSHAADRSGLKAD